MYIVKPIIYTALYIVFIELIGVWLFIADYFEADFLIYDYYVIINGLLMAISLIGFTFLVNDGRLKIPQSTDVKWYIIAIFAGLLYVFIQTPLNWVYNFISGDNFHILFDFNGWENLKNINVISTILLIPIAEELFFREFIQKKLQSQTTSFVAIGITSLLFAALHLPYMEWFSSYSTASIHQAYIVLFVSLVLGYLYFKSKSIGPSIVMHILLNFMVVIV
ncbi:CPBP family intramembrane metalloprotease [Brumimicrobium glaciale]|uniref:CPBP family intramembrane metalloprotease n=1 Tax=Brumimicrobium glaciale TaxID=200475 RepID=A0A4Q4KDA7_9FLAO|nr:CPBP family intramembrane glutamic endopeptidase [Brumimicrobium glaciale]RYM30855.1 CPBP family intramembrane metalloprotease [Brumimicrobium glaciale]